MLGFWGFGFVVLEGLGLGFLGLNLSVFQDLESLNV